MKIGRERERKEGSNLLWNLRRKVEEGTNWRDGSRKQKNSTMVSPI